MADTSDFRTGFTMRHKNGLWSIAEFQHVKPGKGPAFVRTKLKNVENGKVVEHTFRAGEKVELRIVRERRKQTISVTLSPGAGGGEFHIHRFIPLKSRINLKYRIHLLRWSLAGNTRKQGVQIIMRCCRHENIFNILVNILIVINNQNPPNPLCYYCHSLPPVAVTGSRILNLAPCLGPALSPVSLPPISAIRLAALWRPKPCPFSLVVKPKLNI